MLHKHYAVAPIIIIDEYDTPIQQGYQKDYYDKVIQFVRDTVFPAVKSNQHYPLASRRHPAGGQGSITSAG